MAVLLSPAGLVIADGEIDPCLKRAEERRRNLRRSQPEGSQRKPQDTKRRTEEAGATEVSSISSSAPQHESTEPEKPPNTPTPQDTVRRGGLYNDSTDALKTVRDDYLYWSGRLTDSSFQLALALIAANWAVFGSVRNILNNFWSKWSLILVVASLAFNLGGAYVMSQWHRERIDYASDDLDRWEGECSEALKGHTAWPFTKQIERLGYALRMQKTGLPLLSGALFIIALFK